jgi:hypothetical protein
MTPPTTREKEAARPNLGGVKAGPRPRVELETVFWETRQGFEHHHRSCCAFVKPLILPVNFKAQP